MRFLILFLFLAAQGWGATGLDIVDYADMWALACDDTYCYGPDTGAQSRHLFRMQEVGDEVEVYDFGETYNSIEYVFTTTVPGEVFANVCSTATLKCYLYKSVDYADNFGANAPAFDDGNYVSMLGDIDGTEANQIANVKILTPALCDDGTTLYYGEYNINGARVNGSTNDQVRLMKSVDRGATWTVQAKWNTDGVNSNVRHIHYVQYNAPTGNIYIGFGDTDPQSGILLWDRVSAIASDVGLTTYANAKSGAQKYRTGNLLIPSGEYLFYASDTDTPDADRGIWKIKKDLSGDAIRVNSSIIPFDDHSGWYGVLIDDDRMVFCDYLEVGYSDQRTYFYSTSDGGETWDIVASFMSTAGQGGARAFLKRGNYLYFNRAGAGKSANLTVILGVTGEFTGTEPVVVHPVYWVAPTGVDGAAPNGYRPSKPWASLHYALVADRITHGARVIVAPGVYSGNEIAADWDNNFLPGQASVPTVIEGQSADTTEIFLPAASPSGFLLNISKEETPLTIRNIKLYSQKTVGGKAIYVRDHDVRKGALTFEDCILGDTAYAAAGVVLNAEHLIIRRSRIEGYDTGNIGIMASVATGTLTELYSNLFVGHATAVYVDQVPENLFVYNNTFSGYAIRAVGVAAAFAPYIKNNIFGPGVGAINDISGAAVVETDAEIDYNIYGSTVANLENSGGAHSLTASPMFVSSTNFHLRPTSPAINAGVDVGLTTDIEGKAIRGLPDIGAYEFQKTSGVTGKAFLIRNGRHR